MGEPCVGNFEILNQKRGKQEDNQGKRRRAQLAGLSADEMMAH